MYSAIIQPLNKQDLNCCCCHKPKSRTTRQQPFYTTGDQKWTKKKYIFILGGAAGGGYSQVIPMEEVGTISPLRSLRVIISTLRGSNDDALFFYTLL